MLKKIVLDLLEFLFPRYCWVCNRRLVRGEQHLCAACLATLPRTRFHLEPDNSMEQQFWGLFPIQRATALYFYHKKSPGSLLVHHLKYNHHPAVGEYLGRCLALEIRASGFFEGIDYLLPVPLHPKKLRSRGYNQCDCICRGIRQVVNIPMDTTSVVRVVANESQTKHDRLSRRTNVAHIFALTPSAAVNLWNKHVLIVDDVCTTGATITAVGEALAAVEGIRISVLTLGLAGYD